MTQDLSIMENIFESTIKSWLDNHKQTSLNLEDLLEDFIEVVDGCYVYYVEEVFFDDSGDLCGWCMDRDGDEFEIPCLCLSKEVEDKILEKLKDYTPPEPNFHIEKFLRDVYDKNPLF